MPAPHSAQVKECRVRPPCLLKDCWCMRLQVAVIIIALLTVFLGAGIFVYYLHLFVFDVWGSDLFHPRMSLEKEYYSSMSSVSTYFSRASRELCSIRPWLARSPPRRPLRGRAADWRRQPSAVDPDDLPGDAHRALHNVRAARTADAAKNFSNSQSRSGQQRQHRTCMDPGLHYETNARKKVKQKRHKKQHQHFASGSRSSATFREAAARCAPPFLEARRGVARAIHRLGATLTDMHMSRLKRVIEVMCGIGMVLCVVAVVVGVVLMAGVFNNDPALVLPWLLVAGYFAIFNLVYFLCDLGVVQQSTRQRNEAVGAALVLLALCALAIVVLAIFAVTSFFYLIFFVPMYPHHFRNTAQMVVIADEEESDTPEEKSICGSSRRPGRRPED